MSGFDLEGEKEGKPGNNIEAQNLHKTIVNSLKGLYRIKNKLLLYGNKNPLANPINSLTNTLKRKNVALSEIYRNLSKEHSSKSLFDDFGSLIEQAVPERCVADFERDFNSLMTRISNLIHQGVPEEKLKGTDAINKEIETAINKFSISDLITAVYLLFLYQYGYDLHEITTFQLFAGGEYGEGTNIDIHRISPLDATNLWDDENNHKAKLAGISLGAFGGFLDREWRRNDIMWGRLDGAERLITALLPGEQHQKKREDFIDRAHWHILDESIRDWVDELQCSRFKSTRAQEQYETLVDIQKVLHSSEDKNTDSPKKGENKDERAIQRKGPLKCLGERIANMFKQSNPDPTLKNNKAAKTSDDKPYKEPKWKNDFKHAYDFHREMEPEPSLRYLGRASGIVSSMIDGLEEGAGITKKISSYLRKLNTILLAMLDFSTPKTFKGVLFGYWMHLLVLVSIVIITGSYLVEKINSKLQIQSFWDFGLALLSISLIILIFKRFLTTNVHKITCRRSIRWLTSIIIFISLFGLFFVLIALYDTVLNHGNDFLSAFGNAFSHSWKKVTHPIVEYINNLF